MNKDYIKQIIESDENTSSESIKKKHLIKNKKDLINNIINNSDKNERLIQSAINIYESLSDKKKKSIIEEIWYLELKKVLS